MVSRRKRPTRPSKVPRRNAVAKALAQRRYRNRIVPDKRRKVEDVVARVRAREDLKDEVQW